MWISRFVARLTELRGDAAEPAAIIALGQAAFIVLRDIPPEIAAERQLAMTPYNLD